MIPPNLTSDASTYGSDASQCIHPCETWTTAELDNDKFFGHFCQPFWRQRRRSNKNVGVISSQQALIERRQRRLETRPRTKNAANSLSFKYNWQIAKFMILSSLVAILNQQQWLWQHWIIFVSR